jgi:hypothetical protein
VPVSIRRPDTRAGAGEANKNCHRPKHDFKERPKWLWHVGTYPVVAKGEKKHGYQYPATH